MKGLAPLLLGIFGTFAFSWAGLVMIPNAQIGHLDPQTDEEGADAYPVPRSGMAERGRKVYLANGCAYCHSQQVRPDYAAADLDRKWGQRRSAPRDYIFDRPVLLGKMRMGPDLANLGKRAPVDDVNAPPPSATGPATGAPAANAGAAPAAAPAAPAASPSSGTPAVAAASPAAGAPSAPATAAAAPAATAAASSAASGGGASPFPNVGAQTALAESSPTTTIVEHAGELTPLLYSAAWHHRHLYDPRSLVPESNMPSFAFLYEKHPLSGERASDAVNLPGPNGVAGEYEIVPTYDAKCLVAYLMSLDQTHPLKEVKSSVPPSPPAPGQAPAATK